MEREARAPAKHAHKTEPIARLITIKALRKQCLYFIKILNIQIDSSFKIGMVCIGEQGNIRN